MRPGWTVWVPSASAKTHLRPQEIHLPSPRPHPSRRCRSSLATPASFDSEKQNEPINPDDCYFAEAEFRFWDDRWADEQALIASLENNGRMIGACDPSLGKQGRHADDSAIVSLLCDPRSGGLYVLGADVARRNPDRILRNILE